MAEVCAACHSEGVIDGHYEQFDDVVDLYNGEVRRRLRRSWVN